MKRYNLLHSKIALHGNAPHSVLRHHCITFLQENSWQVATIVAPAGFGKSNFTRQYVNHLAEPICWLSIDTDENNICRFMYYAIASIKAVVPDFGDELVDSVRFLVDSFHIIADKILYEIANCGKNILLVIDDYHHIINPQIHDLLQYLIANSPGNFKLLIISREGIPLKLARLRAEKKLVEIEREQLRFDRMEMAQLFSSYYHNSLTESQLADIDSRTEGWPAALQLLCMSAKTIQDLHEYLEQGNKENFTNRYLKDYTREEVLLSYDDRTRNFLLKTSILSSFTPSLCNYVLEAENTLATLDYLQKSNSFIISLDKKNEWFRFHHIFGDVLKDDFEQLFSPAEKSHVHKLASAWYEKNGYLQEAIDHAICSNDFVFVDGFLERNAENRILIGQLNQLFQWFNKMETGKIISPMTKIWMAWVKLFSHKIDVADIEGLLNESIVIYQSNPQNEAIYPTIHAHITAIKGFIATFKCDFYKGIELSLHALEQLKIDNKSLRSGIIFNLSRSYSQLGDLKKTIVYAEEAAALGFECNNYYCAVASINLKAQALMQLMEFDKAEEVYRHCLAIITEYKLQKHPLNGYLYNGLGEIEYYRGNIEKSRELLLTAIVFCEQGKEMRSLLQAHKLMCQLYQTAGDKENLKYYSDRLSNILIKISADLSVREMSAFKIDSDILNNNFSNISDWTRKLIATDAGHFTATREYEDFVKVNVFIIQRNFSEALTAIHRLIADAITLNRRLSLAKFYLCEAKILIHIHKHDKAIVALRKGSGLCAEGGTKILLHQAKQWLPASLQGSDSCTAGLMLLPAASYETCAVEGVAQGKGLTDREREIMHFIKKGLSNKQISSTLNISEGTVKRHVHNIFSKLSVKNRIEAIRSQEILHADSQ